MIHLRVCVKKQPPLQMPLVVVVVASDRARAHRAEEPSSAPRSRSAHKHKRALPFYTSFSTAQRARYLRRTQEHHHHRQSWRSGRASRGRCSRPCASSTSSTSTRACSRATRRRCVMFVSRRPRARLIEPRAGSFRGNAGAEDEPKKTYHAVAALGGVRALGGVGSHCSLSPHARARSHGRPRHTRAAAEGRDLARPPPLQLTPV